MRIMIVAGGFLPAKNYGGPVVSIENIVSLVNDFDFWIVTRDHDWKNKEKLTGIERGWNTFLDNTKVIYLSDKEHNKANYVRIINEIEPDIIYINGFYLAQMFVPMIKAAKNKNVCLLLAPRGTLNKNALAINSFKKHVYISYMSFLLRKCNCFFHSTSGEETYQIQKLLNVKKEKVFEVANIPSFPKIKSVPHIKETNKLVCCFFARICEKKNLYGALEILKDTISNIQFKIYGNKEDSDYWEKCCRIIDTLPPNIKVEYMGGYSHENVFQLMSQNDLMLFPTLSENYGHVIAEALFSGLPVIISDQTPWNGINDAGCGRAIPLSEKDTFIEYLEMYSRMNNDEFSKIRTKAIEYVTEVSDLNGIKRMYKKMFQLEC